MELVISTHYANVSAFLALSIFSSSCYNMASLFISRGERGDDLEIWKQEPPPLMLSDLCDENSNPLIQQTDVFDKYVVNPLNKMSNYLTSITLSRLPYKESEKRVSNLLLRSLAADFVRIYVSNGRVAPCDRGVPTRHPFLMDLVSAHGKENKFVPTVFEFILILIVERKLEVTRTHLVKKMNKDQVDAMNTHLKEEKLTNRSDLAFCVNTKLAAEWGHFLPIPDGEVAPGEPETMAERLHLSPHVARILKSDLSRRSGKPKAPGGLCLERPPVGFVRFIFRLKEYPGTWMTLPELFNIITNNVISVEDRVSVEGDEAKGDDAKGDEAKGVDAEKTYDDWRTEGFAPCHGTAVLKTLGSNLGSFLKQRLEKRAPASSAKAPPASSAKAPPTQEPGAQPSQSSEAEVELLKKELDEAKRKNHRLSQRIRSSPIARKPPRKPSTPVKKPKSKRGKSAKEAPATGSQEESSEDEKMDDVEDDSLEEDVGEESDEESNKSEPISEDDSLLEDALVNFRTSDEIRDMSEQERQDLLAYVSECLLENYKLVPLLANAAVSPSDEYMALLESAMQLCVMSYSVLSAQKKAMMDGKFIDYLRPEAEVHFLNLQRARYGRDPDSGSWRRMSPPAEIEDNSVGQTFPGVGPESEEWMSRMKRRTAQSKDFLAIDDMALSGYGSVALDMIYRSAENGWSDMAQVGSLDPSHEFVEGQLPTSEYGLRQLWGETPQPAAAHANSELSTIVEQSKQQLSDEDLAAALSLSAADGSADAGFEDDDGEGVPEVTGKRKGASLKDAKDYQGKKGKKRKRCFDSDSGGDDNSDSDSDE